MSTIVQQAARHAAPQLAELTFFTGGWESEGTFHATPLSSGKPICLSVDADVVHRGHWIRTRATEHPSVGNPNPPTATGLWWYDPEAGRFRAEWFDNCGRRGTQTSTGWDDDRVVFTGRLDTGGCSFLVRDTFTRRDDDEYSHLGEVYLGQAWVPVHEELAHRRRGG